MDPRATNLASAARVIFFVLRWIRLDTFLVRVICEIHIHLCALGGRSSLIFCSQSKEWRNRPGSRLCGRLGGLLICRLWSRWLCCGWLAPGLTTILAAGSASNSMSVVSSSGVMPAYMEEFSNLALWRSYMQSISASCRKLQGRMQNQLSLMGIGQRNPTRAVSPLGFTSW